MSHWEQPPYVGACTGCAWTCEAITAGTLDVALDEHSRVWGHHLFAISSSER